MISFPSDLPAKDALQNTDRVIAELTEHVEKLTREREHLLELKRLLEEERKK